MEAVEIARQKRARGRPRGRTRRGAARKQELYSTCLSVIAETGYEQATMREIASRAGVSPGLLYKYFPSKRSVVIELNDRLSSEYATNMSGQQARRWTEGFLLALESSLEVLAPHRDVLKALTATLVSNTGDGVFSHERRESRILVQSAFEQIVATAEDAPKHGAALGRVLYLIHLGVILWWLLDRSPNQRATRGLVSMLGTLMPVFRLVLKLPAGTQALLSLDRLFREGLLGEC